MQNWIIPVDEKNQPQYYFDKDGCIDWEKHNYGYEVNDIVYIYLNKPIGRVKWKTKVIKTNFPISDALYPEEFFNSNSEYLVRFELLEQVDKEELSYENLLENGLNGPIFGPRRLNGSLLNYIEKYFQVDAVKMWMVRAGEKGFLYDEIKKRNIVVIGWGIGDVKNLSKDEIIKLLNEKQKDLPEKEKKTEGGINQNASTIVRFRDELKKGDYVASASPSSERYLLGEIISDYYFSDELIEDKVDDKEKYNNLRKVKWLCEISSDELSESAISFLGSNKTLFRVNDDAIEEILSFYLGGRWKNKPRNVIYFGAPGTGKSFNLNLDKEKLLCCKNAYERVTFHPDYSYANFVGTYKPRPKKDKEGKKTDGITYEYVPGPFMRSLVKALKNPDKPFLLIIEEINRANVAAVFGDIFQLLDRDENNESEYPIETSEDMRDYLEKKLGKVYKKIKIPSNMFIWATMNSADQGVFPMDTAFKRRWHFKYIGIDENKSEIKNIKIKTNNQEIYWNELREAINEVLISFRINEDKLLGPFFAFNEFKDKEDFTEDDFEEINEIFKNKVIMYLFEDAARSKRDKLFAGAKGDNDYVIFSQVCRSFDDEGIGIFCDKIKKQFSNE